MTEMTTFNDDFSAFDDVTLVDNQDPRCPVVLVLDCSDSMTQPLENGGRSPLEALNGGLDTLITALNKDPLAKRRVEVSIVSYGTEVSPATPFATVENIVLPTLVSSGVTSTGKAVEVALDAVEARKKVYKENGINYYKPWVLLITDGLATDNTATAIERSRDLEGKNRLAFFAVGVEGSDLDALGKFSSRGALALDGIKFEELFEWVSQSQAAVSASNPGDSVPLPAPSGWASV